MNIIKKKNNKTGVTLVEMMISLLIIGIVFAVGYAFMNRTFVSMKRQKQSLDTLHEARSFLLHIERDLREMTKVLEIDTVFKGSLFHEQNALLHKIVIEVPKRKGSGVDKVTYVYEGPDNHIDTKGRDKFIYRQVNGKVKQALITKQLNFLKIWGTDGTIFRNRNSGETLPVYQTYLAPHYYHPSTPVAGGLRDINKIRGIEVQLCMHEMVDEDGKPIKDRTFITRIYPRILNSKYE